MLSRHSLSAVAAAALTLSGCLAEQEPLTPSATAPALALSASGAPPSQHLVSFHGKGIPTSFAGEVARLGGSVLYTHSGTGLALVSGLDAAEAAALGAKKGVAEVHADEFVVLAGYRSAPETLGNPVAQGHANPPGDAFFADFQWNMAAISAPAAWDAGLHGSRDVTVAILDTGIDYDAIDLAGLVDLSRSASFVPGDDAIAAAYFPWRHPVTDFNGHGTNVAQQVSSHAIAFAGVTSHTTLIGVKVLGANGSGSLGGILFGMLWAADHGADVINMSLGSYRLKAGGGGGLQSLINAVLSYVGRAGALVVVAAGNESADLDRNLLPVPELGEVFHLPSLESDYCTATHVLCVSSVGPTTAGGSADVPSIFTNFGRSAVDVAGPGGNVGEEVSIWPWGPDVLSWVWSLCAKDLLILDDEGEVVLDPAGRPVTPCASGFWINAMVGTSQAAPHVSGLAALLIAENGGARPSQLKATIRNSAVDLGQSGNDPHFGKGRVDVARALGL